MGFPNVPPTSFGMPQPYSQAPAPYPTQSMYPIPGNIPAQNNTYPLQQMPYPPQPMPHHPTCYPTNTHSNQSAPSPYPQQQNYNMYPNLQKAPEAKEYFNSMAPSPYSSGPNIHTTHTAHSSTPYQSGSYPGGQGVNSKYSYAANSPTAATHGTTPAPRRDQFTPKVRLRVVQDFFKQVKDEILNVLCTGIKKAAIVILQKSSLYYSLHKFVKFLSIYFKYFTDFVIDFSHGCAL